MSNPATEIIQPASHSNARSEWRLPSSGVYTNLRLVGVGVTTTGGIAQFTDQGVYSLINVISLWDGGTLLAEVRDAWHWMAFAMLRGPRRDNGGAFSLHGALAGAASSWALSRGDAATLSRLPSRNWYATTDATTTFQGWVPLAGLFPLIEALGQVDTALFRNFRVVVEWRTAPIAGIFAGNTAGITIADGAVLRARLFADPAEAKREMPSAVPFSTLLLEKVALPGAAAQPEGAVTVPLQTRVRLLGANGRSVSRMALITVDPTLDAATVGDTRKSACSVATESESWQFLVNGVPMFPFNGCDTPGRKHASLALTFGGFSAPSGSHIRSTIPNGSPGAGTQPLAGLYDPASTPAQIAGRFSYGGFILARRIGDLQLIHNRTATTYQWTPLVLNVYYETANVLTINKSAGAATYSISVA